MAVNEDGESLEGALITIYNAVLVTESNQYGEIVIDDGEVDGGAGATQLDNDLGFDTG